MNTAYNKIFLLIVYSIAATTVCAQSYDAGLESIGSKDLMSTVHHLCSKECDGRLPGSEGYNKAAGFTADKFEKIGLSPAGDENYFQYLNVEYNRIDTPAVFNIITSKENIYCRHGEEFVLRGFTGSGEFKLPVVFCGYGISRPDLGYDDYGNIDVTDKIVMVFKQNPDWKINDENWGNEYPREKSNVAKNHGARAILFVSRPKDKIPQPLIGSVMHGDGEQPEDFPQLHISIEAANRLLESGGQSLIQYQNKIDETKIPASANTMNLAEIKVNAGYKKTAGTMNVVGMIEGSDPGLKNEYLIIGAHLDHVGSQAALLFPGANDNASGSAAVLEIAEAFGLSNIRPRRSVIFVLFASEEQGLHGSRHFAENMKSDSGNIAAMLNLDCVGYGDSIQIGNGKSASVLWEMVKNIDAENYNLIVSNTWNGGGADATPFHEKGIPCLYFVSKNSYDHLHLPSDTPETLNPELFEKIVRLAYLTARMIADGNYDREEIIN